MSLHIHINYGSPLSTTLRFDGHAQQQALQDGLKELLSRLAAPQDAALKPMIEHAVNLEVLSESTQARLESQWLALEMALHLMDRVVSPPDPATWNQLKQQFVAQLASARPHSELASRASEPRPDYSRLGMIPLGSEV